MSTEERLIEFEELFLKGMDNMDETDYLNFITLEKTLGIIDMVNDVKTKLTERGNGINTIINGVKVTLKYDVDRALNEERYKRDNPAVFDKLMAEKLSKVHLTIADIENSKDEMGFKRKVGTAYIQTTDKKKGTLRLVLPKVSTE